jgi:Tfp pilus assembly protein PilN
MNFNGGNMIDPRSTRAYKLEKENKKLKEEIQALKEELEKQKQMLEKRINEYK